MKSRISWHILLMATALAAAVVAAVLEIGPPSSSARTARQIVSAADGVVQSTVTGTGNVEPRTDVAADFQTTGVLQHVYVKVGEHVIKGQLLATLDPTSAQLALSQAQEQLTSARDQLANAENEKTTSSSTAASDTSPRSTTELIAYRPTQTTTSTRSGTTSTPTTPPPSTTTPRSTAPTQTTTTRTTTTSATASPRPPAGSGSSSSSPGSASGSGSTGTRSTGTGASGGGSSSGAVTPQTKAANIASAQASVDGAEASVRTAENTLHETHLYAPATGTVVSVSSLSAGDSVSAGSAGSGAGSASSNASSSSGGSGTTAGGLGGGTGTGASSASSGFIEIISTRALTISVPFSESDIGHVKVGQSADVTLEALTGVELAGHVSSISPVGTNSSGVVSYDATIAIDQRNRRVRPGMSASVSVITGQASGVNVPSSAVTGGAGSVSRVDVLRNGHTVSTPVVVGLVGSSRTQIVSGLKAGQQIVVTETLPSLSSGSTSGTGSTGTLGGSRLGGGGLAGGGFTGRPRFFGGRGFAGGG